MNLGKAHATLRSLLEAASQLCDAMTGLIPPPPVVPDGWTRRTPTRGNSNNIVRARKPRSDKGKTRGKRKPVKRRRIPPIVPVPK